MTPGPRKVALIHPQHRKEKDAHEQEADPCDRNGREVGGHHTTGHQGAAPQDGGQRKSEVGNQHRGIIGGPAKAVNAKGQAAMHKFRRTYYDLFSKFYGRFIALHATDKQGVLRDILAG